MKPNAEACEAKLEEVIAPLFPSAVTRLAKVTEPPVLPLISRKGNKSFEAGVIWDKPATKLFTPDGAVVPFVPPDAIGTAPTIWAPIVFGYSVS